MTDSTLRRGLFVAFAVLWSALAIAPTYRADWAVENILVLVLVAIGIAFRRALLLSRSGSVMLFAFLVLHEVGAHYTYSEVPYDSWFRALTGRGFNTLLGLQRNHYDRLVHFAAGLLLVAPMRELLKRRHALSSRVSYLLPINLVMSGSMLYELIEWGAALLFGGDLGAAYLGTQGDPWDAQKDMALATLGSVLAAGLGVVFQRLRGSPRALPPM